MSNTEMTYEEELQRIAEKYGCSDIHGVKQALEAGEIKRTDARRLLLDMGSPARKLKIQNALRANGLSNRPQPSSAEDAAVQATMEIIMKLLRGLLGIRTAEDIERERDRKEAILQNRNIDQTHGNLMRILPQIEPPAEAANDDEFVSLTRVRARRP